MTGASRPVVSIDELIIGHAGNVDRFASRHHYAGYNATAPIEASSGDEVRHRLNPRGNRQLNWTIQVIAISQLRHDTIGRRYDDRKLEQGKTSEEALRALKRRISDTVSSTTPDNCAADVSGGPGRTLRNDSVSSVTGLAS